MKNETRKSDAIHHSHHKLTNLNWVVFSQEYNEEEKEAYEVFRVFIPTTCVPYKRVSPYSSRLSLALRKISTFREHTGRKSTK